MLIKFLAGIATAGFLAATAVDWLNYPAYVDKGSSAPFYAFVAANAACCFIPAAILILLAKFIWSS